MAIADLCEAAVTLSDNTAANLLLGNSGRRTGHPLTAWLRAFMATAFTRLDRISNRR